MFVKNQNDCSQPLDFPKQFRININTEIELMNIKKFHTYIQVYITYNKIGNTHNNPCNV